MRLTHTFLRHGRTTAILAFLLTGVTAGNVSAATILSTTTALGGNIFHFDYFISNANLLANYEVDIEFDPALYGSLTNGIAGSDFNLLLFQPNNPPGAVGVYSALALVDHPSLAGPFSVDALYLGSGTPGPQRFSITAINSDHQVGGILDSGDVGAIGTVPEPAGWSLAALGVGLLALGARRRDRRSN